MKQAEITEDKRYNMQIMDIVKQLDTYRLEKKISQQELADKLDVAFSTVNRWFTGKARPNKIQTFHIQKLLNHKKRT